MSETFTFTFDAEFEQVMRGFCGKRGIEFIIEKENDHGYSCDVPRMMWPEWGIELDPVLGLGSEVFFLKITVQSKASAKLLLMRFGTEFAKFDQFIADPNRLWPR